VTLAGFAAHFGGAGPPDLVWDLNRDGAVNVFDLAQLASVFGRRC
jgi:hypothetical protein